MERAKEWSRPPWEVTGEKLTQWRRMVWLLRHNFYTDQYNSMIRRKNHEMELKRLQNG